jgi:hypothetical protein
METAPEIVPGPSGIRTGRADPKSRTRSLLTNGSSLLPTPVPTLAEYLATLQAQEEVNSATLRGEILNPDSEEGS